MPIPSAPPEPSVPVPSPETPAGRGRLSAAIIELAAKHANGDLCFRDLFENLTGRGHAALLIVLGLPFCLPIPLPGLSVIFGIVLMFVGLRIAFGHRPWLPRWLLDRPLKTDTLLGLARGLASFERRTSRMLRPRLLLLCRDPRIHRLNGIIVALMGILLALPLPIPFTNIPAAIPILMLGLGMLEDDGLFVVIGYAAAFFAFGLFVALFWFGGVGLKHIIDEWQKRWG
jgi:hypothetical protein